MATPMGAPAGASAGMGATGAAPDMSKYKMPMILGIVGGLLALVGALIGWLQIQACVLGMCIAVPMPPGVGIGSYDALMGIAPTLVMVVGLVGLVLMVLKKPMFAMIGGVMGIVGLLMCVLYLMKAGQLSQALNALMGGTGGSVSVGASIGLWLSLIGSLLLTVGGLMGFKALKGAAPAAPAA